MARYISCADTAKLIRVELKKNFPGIKFSVKSSSYAGGASISISWTDGPACPTVEKITNRFAGASFDGMTDSTTYRTSEIGGEEVRFGSDYVSCSRSTTMAYVQAIVAAYCTRWGYPASKMKINGNAERAYVDSYALGYSEENWFNEIFHTTDAKDMHRPYEAKEEREQAEQDEYVRNEPVRRAQAQRDELERARLEAERERLARAREEVRRQQEEKRQREQAARRTTTAIRTREQALTFLGLSSTSTPEEIKRAFYLKVKQASDGKGGYTADMDTLTQAKEKALGR